MAITVTATQGGPTAVGMILRVKVLTNAAVQSLQVGNTATQVGAAAHQAVITTTATGSIVYGAVLDVGSTAYTANADTTLFDNLSVFGSLQMGTLRSTAATGTPGSITIGCSAPADSGLLALGEILPVIGQSIAEDASGPAVVNSSATSATTASFNPPLGSLLVAIIDSNAGNGILTMAMSNTGQALNWTSLITNSPSSSGGTFIFIAQYTLTSLDTATGTVIAVAQYAITSIISGTATGKVTATPGGSWLPPGVKLQEIDGGPNYYQNNGFTNAYNAGWDSPSFFPIGDDYCFYPGNSIATFFDVGLNFSHRVTADTDMTLLRNNNVWALTEGQGTNFGTETIGWHIEEPADWASIAAEVQGYGNDLANRLIQISNTWNQFVYGGYAGTPGDGSMKAVMDSPISTSIGNVHLDIPGDDIYWFAGSTISGYAPYYGQLIYGTSALLTADQCARGCHYGDMVDFMRQWLTTYPAPVGAPYIETEDGLTGAGSREITPPELNWAVWSTIIHGARWILYFGTTSNFGSGPTFGFSTSILPGQSISMYTQGKATNGLVKQLAPVINAPFMLNYFTVSPPAVVLSASTADSGIDAMAKWYGGGGSLANGYYIFATTRESETVTNLSATFTTSGHYTGPVTVVNESRTVSATNGVFSDTFANSWTVHIYQIPVSSTLINATAVISGSG